MHFLGLNELNTPKRRYFKRILALRKVSEKVSSINCLFSPCGTGVILAASHVGMGASGEETRAMSH